MNKQTITYEQERVGNYIQTYTGNFFYPLDPRPEDINIIDIAHSLSHICRFTGHGERFYSVGEHSIHCANVAKQLGYSTLLQLYALCHDASESVVNDLARPVKQDIPQYKEVENKIMSVIWDMLGLPHPTEEDYKKVKLIDNTLIVNEMMQLMKPVGNNIQRLLDEVECEAIHVDLSTEYTFGEIKGEFLKMYTSLMEDYLNEEEEAR